MPAIVLANLHFRAQIPDNPPRPNFSFVVRFWPAGFDKPEPCIRRQFVCKRLPARPAVPFDVLPVIHACTLELRVIEPEAEWLDEMHSCWPAPPIPIPPCCPPKPRSAIQRHAGPCRRRSGRQRRLRSDEYLRGDVGPVARRASCAMAWPVNSSAGSPPVCRT